MSRKLYKCVGCGALVPVGGVSVDPCDDLVVVCAACERERIEEEEREHEERESWEAERVTNRYLWD